MRALLLAVAALALTIGAAHAQGAEVGLAEKFLTVYGPLGLGWLGFAWALWRNARLQDQLLVALQDNTKANTLLAERLTGNSK